jgi:hypothetical protein
VSAVSTASKGTEVSSESDSTGGHVAHQCSELWGGGGGGGKRLLVTWLASPLTISKSTNFVCTEDNIA